MWLVSLDSYTGTSMCFNIDHSPPLYPLPLLASVLCVLASEEFSGACRRNMPHYTPLSSTLCIQSKVLAGCVSACVSQTRLNNLSSSSLLLTPHSDRPDKQSCLGWIWPCLKLVSPHSVSEWFLTYLNVSVHLVFISRFQKENTATTLWF